MTTLLAMDLGGTKCAVGLFHLKEDGFEPLWKKVYSSTAYEDIDDLISHFLEEGGLLPDYACLGVAGVVNNGAAQMTNLPWQMEEASLKEKYSFAGVRLINDMTALCSAVPALKEDETVVLQEGEVDSQGVAAIIAPGTGLGQGFLLETGQLFYPRGTEGGHARFSPVDEQQLELLNWLRETHDVVSQEMVCAGPAISTLYDFLLNQGHRESPGVAGGFKEEGDRTRVIVSHALLETPCPTCLKSVELFLSLLGTEAANAALKLYSTRGVFLGGGILPKLVGKMSFSPFVDAFNRMGVMESLVNRIPLHLIVKEDVVLDGVVRYGRLAFRS